MEVKEKVFDVIASILDVDTSQIMLNSTIGDFPLWDSLGHLNILQSIQDEFEIEIEPEEMLDIEDVNDIVKAVEAKL